MKLAIIGYGKMGKAIEEIAVKRGHEVCLKINLDNIEEFTIENLKKADVAIEFTIPKSAVENFKKCFEAKLPLVSGTTGWLDRKEEIENDCLKNETAFFHASNFSIGMNIFFNLNKKLANLMNNFDEYDVSLDETHHVHKLDAPSGTAIVLAQDVIDNLERKNTWKEEENLQENEIAVKSHRIGEVPGTHTINYNSEVDEISITHRAKSRKGFAFGAVLAAEFLVGKKGIFGMEDMLNLGE